MSEIYLLRHAEKGPDGMLTERGEKLARALGASLPRFTLVISSPSPRAVRTAELVSGQTPTTDERANFYMATSEKSDAINALATRKNMTFLEAVQEYADPEVLEGIDARATELNTLIAELLGKEEVALVVSHDLSISPAVAQQGIPLESIEPLGGYVIADTGEITSFRPQSL